MVASHSAVSASFWMRVGTLPRMGTVWMSGRSALICAARRVLLVAMVAPWGSARRLRFALKPRAAAALGDQSSSGFGASAPYKELYKLFGITPEAVTAAIMSRHNQ